MSIEGHTNNRTIYIIDEVDAVMLDKTIKFSSCTSSKPLNIIGLTATKEKDFWQYESDYLKEFGFEFFDSKI